MRYLSGEHVLTTRLVISVFLLATGLGAVILAFVEHRAIRSAQQPAVEWLLTGDQRWTFAWSVEQANAHARWCISARLDPAVSVLSGQVASVRCRNVADRMLARNPKSGVGWAVHAAYTNDLLSGLARSRLFAPNEGWLARARLALAVNGGDRGAGTRSDARILATSVHEVARFETFYRQADPNTRAWLASVTSGGAE